MADEIAERVKRVTAEMLKVDPEKVTESAHFVADLGASSIQSIELVAAYEEEFDVEMDQDDALAVENVGEAIKYIRKVVEEQQGG